ncbi:MAG: TauD/TfdA family dioxygenase [Byssovorax sp.]
MSDEPWIFRGPQDRPRIQAELDDRGYARFHAPELLGMTGDPPAICRLLFGAEPLRMRCQEIRPDPRDPLRTGYWRSIREAKIHTDGPALGIPPSALVMLCKQPAAEAGDTLLLDTWALLRVIEAEDPALFAALFRVPRRLQFAEADHWGPTVSLRRGHLIAYHPPFPDPACDIARRFQVFVDRAPKVQFRSAAGEVFLVNNHRCLHGRLAFEDLGRTFVRVMLWLPDPFTAPADFKARAIEGSAQLAADLAGEPRWLRERFGVDVPAPSPAALERLRLAIDLLQRPRETIDLPPAEARELCELQDRLLSSCLPALGEALPPLEERLALTERALAVLRSRGD